MSPSGDGRVAVEIDGHELSLSNLDKVLYPAAGFTKAEVIDYYTRVGPALVPHLAGRPITLKRYPNGVDGPSFYEKNCPSHRPEWVQTVEMGGGSRRSQVVRYCLLDSVAHLVWTANLAALELHPALASAPDLNRPRSVVFDLDPGAPADVVDCGRVALWLRELLAHLGLQAWPKTSGSKGLQVYVPLNTPCVYEDTRAFALAAGQLLEREHGDAVLTNMNPAQRGGKIFIDWSQNVASKTTVAVYSLRARERPTVSTPVDWEEVAAAVEANDPSALRFEAPQVLARVEADGDRFAPLLTVEQEVPKAAS
ncbi:MAG TPA: non-homologous end-joining DNA ligase [Acidimicrobiales bacterium]|nr:non-homologous end-joining DNA ligase [Acidimicrobiales bacterium]